MSDSPNIVQHIAGDWYVLLNEDKSNPSNNIYLCNDGTTKKREDTFLFASRDLSVGSPYFGNRKVAEAALSEYLNGKEEPWVTNVGMLPSELPF